MSGSYVPVLRVQFHFVRLPREIQECSERLSDIFTPLQSFVKKNYSFLAVRQRLFCHCHKRSRGQAYCTKTSGDDNGCPQSASPVARVALTHASQVLPATGQHVGEPAAQLGGRVAARRPGKAAAVLAQHLVFARVRPWADKGSAWWPTLTPSGDVPPRSTMETASRNGSSVSWLMCRELRGIANAEDSWGEELPIQTQSTATKKELAYGTNGTTLAAVYRCAAARACGFALHHFCAHSGAKKTRRGDGETTVASTI